MEKNSSEACYQRRYRTLFLSDIHLGTKACQAHLLLDFLKYNEADTIFFVGDIIDFWQFRRAVYWPQLHNDVIQKILRKGRKGARIVYIPGNHDEAMREYDYNAFGSIEIVRDAVFEALDGRRLLILHGDEFDVIVRYARWLALLGHWAYGAALWTNTYVNRFRKWLDLPYWSLAAHLKFKVKKAVNYLGEFESAITEEAKRRECDGVVCGHIHHAAIQEVRGITYMNCGDWVESCTAIGETLEGKFELIHWRMAGIGGSVPDVRTQPLGAVA